MPYRISVDTGGTFIDVVVGDGHGNHYIGKALTTHARVFEGLQVALERAAAQVDLSAHQLLRETDVFIYGTTRATNAIVTRNVARTAFLTTEGFPDILVLKEGGKQNGYDYSKPFPQPYISRRSTFEIPERITSEGLVDTALDEDSVRQTLSRIVDDRYEAIAVCLLWSIANPAHELRIGELIEQIAPGTAYTLSHLITPTIREYRRASATAIDASLKPLMQTHLRGLDADLRQFGYTGQLLVSTSVGGVMGIDEVITAPINMAKSGPAMAPVAGVNYSLAEGFGGNMVVCDTGGTTFDVGLSRDGELIHSRDTWLGTPMEGELLGISSVDIQSLGAGGGSIAWVDKGGLLRVGPQSAGSEPGPACYGRGGAEPTLSDAACVLGYFDPDYFLGGQMALDVSAARTAVGTIADRLGLGVDETAWGILTLASDAMIKAVQEITISQGLNPQESTIVAGGGASGINILQIAAELGAERVVFPQTASALSATGMHFADIVKEESASTVTSSVNFDFDRVNATLVRLRSRLQEFAGRLGLGADEYTIDFQTEARYRGQVWDLGTPLAAESFESADDVAAAAEAFHLVHERLFSVRDEGSPVEFINWKARLVAGLGDRPRVATASETRSVTARRSRSCYFGGAERLQTPVFIGGELTSGDCIDGPAIVQEATTTLVVFPGMSAAKSTSGNYVLHIDTER